MAFYREEETRSAIENFVRWRGDGASVRSAMSILGVLRTELTHRGPAIPSIGIDAGRTEQALERMGERQARALVLYHGTDRSGEASAAELGCSRRTFYSLLEAAHPAYWAALDAISLETRQAAATADKARQYHAAARAIATAPTSPPSADLPRIPRRRRKARPA